MAIFRRNRQNQDRRQPRGRGGLLRGRSSSSRSRLQPSRPVADRMPSVNRNVSAPQVPAAIPEPASPSDAVVPEKGNYLSGMANLSVNPRTGFSRMRYVDGVEMTPARRMFQRGMNETLKQQKGDPELAQGYFTRAYRFGQAQGLEGPEMDMIQQKSFDTRRNNMSLRAGTMTPYYADERDPKTGAFIPPEDRISAYGGQMSISARTPSKREKLPSVSQSILQGTSAPSSSVSYPVKPGNEDFDKILDSSSRQDQANKALAELNAPLPKASSQGVPSLSDSLNESLNMEALANDAAAYIYGVPAQPQLRAPFQNQLVDDFVQGLNPSNLMSQVPTVVGRSTGGAIRTGEDAMPSPPSPNRQRSSMRDQIRSQARAENTSGVENVRSAYEPIFNDQARGLATPVDAQAEYARRQQLRSDIQRQRVAAQGDPARSSVGVAQPAPPPNTGAFGYKTYTSDNGQFSRDAVVMGIRNGKAVMQYTNGSVSEVPLDRLSPESREQAIAAASARDFVRGSDADGMPVNRSETMNRMFGGRDRNELYSSTTGRMTAGDPDAYTRQQAFNSAYGIAPPENPPIDEALVAQSGRNARNRLAKATQPGGLPDIPDPDPSRPLLAPRGSAYYNPDDARNRRAFVPLGDRYVGQRDIYGGGVSNVNRVTAPDRDGSLRNVVSGMNTAIDDNGNMLEMRVNPGTGVQEPVLDQYGRPLAIDDSQRGRRFAVGSDGNIVPGSMTTVPTTARGRREAIIEQANSPDATPEQIAAADKAREELDKYNSYMDRRDQRRQDAVDLNAAAAQLRSYGQTGQQFMGYNALGQPVNQPVFGQTGPSRAQAIGQVKREREAQKRLDKEMKRQQEVEDREMKIKEDEAAARKAEAEVLRKRGERMDEMDQLDLENQKRKAQISKRQDELAMSPYMGGQMFFENSDAKMRANGVRAIANASDLTEDQKGWYLVHQFGITDTDQLNEALTAAGYDPPGLSWASGIFNWYQSDGVDRVRNQTLDGLSGALPGRELPRNK